MPNASRLAAAVTGKLTGRLGRCTKCMHTAFLTAVGAMAVAAILWLVQSPPAYAVLAFSAAGLVVTLWIAHVWMFTLRSARATAVLVVPEGHSAPQPWTRRRLLGAFLRVLVFSAVASAIPRSLRAQECNCYTENDCYCPDAFPQCVYNPTTGEGICCGPSAVGCAGPSSTWCCAPGTNCYGTSNQCY